MPDQETKPKEETRTEKAQERAVLPTSTMELRQEGEQEGLPTIVGYAAVFNSLSVPMFDFGIGEFREVIRPGAFDNALAEVEAGNQDVSARIQHEGGLTTIGRTSNGTLRLTVDDRGLFYEITPPNTQAARDLVEQLRGGYINKSSFAFIIDEDGDRIVMNDDQPIREILDIRELVDVAPVDGPAYDATIAEVRKKKAQAAGIEVPEEPETDEDAELRAKIDKRMRKVRGGDDEDAVPDVPEQQESLD